MEQLDIIDYIENTTDYKANKTDVIIDSEAEVILSKSVVSENLFPGFTFEDIREINSM